MTKPDVHVHDQRFDGDDPYLVCSGCGERWDALTGRAVRAVPVMTKPDDLSLREAREEYVQVLNRASRDNWFEQMRGHLAWLDNALRSSASTTVDASAALAAIPSEVDVERLARAVKTVKENMRLDIVANDANGDYAMTLWADELASLLAAAYAADVKEPTP